MEGQNNSYSTHEQAAAEGHSCGGSQTEESSYSKERQGNMETQGMQGMMQSPQQSMMQSPQQGMMQSPQQGMMQSPQQGMMQNPQQGMMQSPQQGMMPNMQGMMQSPQQGMMPNMQGMMQNPQQGMMPNMQGMGSPLQYQGIGMGTPLQYQGSGMAPHSPAHEGAPSMAPEGAGTHTAQNEENIMNQFGKYFGVISDFANGNPPDLAQVAQMVQETPGDFWKGLIVGAATGLLVTNETVRNGAMSVLTPILGKFNIGNSQEPETEGDSNE